jgi:FkbM family methyltransferase
MTKDIPELGGLVHYRPEGSDLGTIQDVLAGYHLPPEWLKPKLIFDLGAYAGYTTRDFALRYPDAEIIAVEMDEENEALCRKNTKGCPHVWVVHAAVVGPHRAAERATVRYRRNLHGQNAHRLDEYFGDRAVSATSLPFLVEMFGVPDYIKMDIEGAELEALWDFNEPCCISVECHDEQKMDVRILLQENGYDVTTSTAHFSSLLAVPAWWGQVAT